MISHRAAILIVAIGHIAGCGGRAVQGHPVLTSHEVRSVESDPNASHLPISLYFCVGNSRSVDIDSHGVIKVSVLGDQWYGKISADQRHRLDELLLSAEYSQALGRLDPWPNGPLMCYGDPYALLTHSSRHLSYMIQLSDSESIPRPVWELLALIDELGGEIFEALYKPILPDLVSSTPNNRLKLTVTSLACARAAPAA